MPSSLELAAMRRAIAVSARGLGGTSPNPPVGCVILDRDGRLVGEGFHVRKGEAHAEANALAAAGGDAEGGTAVVTLEPCNHHGRTPPCRQALLDAGVARVLIAVMDPTSRGDGGASVLRQAGVSVEQDVLREEALLVLGPWRASLEYGRPFITWVYETSPDGTPVNGDARGPAAREVASLRGAYDLVIRWNGTVEEGVPDAHGSDDFRVPSVPPGGCGAAVSPLMKILRESGARSVLIEGCHDRAAALVAAGAVDEVVACLPIAPHSWRPGAAGAYLSPIPGGYRLADAVRREDHVRMVGRKAGADGRVVRSRVDGESATDAGP